MNVTSSHLTSKQNHFTYITSVHSTSLHFFAFNPHLNLLSCNYIFNRLSKGVYIIGEIFEVDLAQHLCNLDLRF